MADYEPDRALADIDCLALRERVREAIAILNDPKGIARISRAKATLRAALADHREGEE